MDIICELCNTKITNKKDISKHQKTKKCQEIYKIVILKNNLFINQIKEYKIEIEKLLKNNIILKKEIEDKDKQIKLLQEKSDEYRKIVEKVATKSTKTTVNNNNNNTYNRNNYLNYVSTEPIKFGEIQQKINNLITTKTIMYDNDDFNNYITKNILKDENGKDKVLCTDINRKNFTYKDETSGQMISDPELERLREKLKNTSNNTSVKKDLLDKLISKYEGTGIDPYVRFYECLQNIEYGQPFVEHVAKKTYVKNKPLFDKENEEDYIENDSKKLEFKNENDETDTQIVQNKDNAKTNISRPSIDDDIDIDNVNIEEIDDIEILDRIIMKYEKRMNEKQIKIETNII
jgi:hypothetical protein